MRFTASQLCANVRDDLLILLEFQKYVVKSGDHKLMLLLCSQTLLYKTFQPIEHPFAHNFKSCIWSFQIAKQMQRVRKGGNMHAAEQKIMYQYPILVLMIEHKRRCSYGNIKCRNTELHIFSLGLG